MEVIVENCTHIMFSEGWWALELFSLLRGKLLALLPWHVGEVILEVGHTTSPLLDPLVEVHFGIPHLSLERGVSVSAAVALSEVMQLSCMNKNAAELHKCVWF